MVAFALLAFFGGGDWATGSNVATGSIRFCTGMIGMVLVDISMSLEVIKKTHPTEPPKGAN